MIKPQFPFKENQIILSSNRIVLHSKTDGIFLFGAATVSLSSQQTINLDAKEKVIISSPKIELVGFQEGKNMEAFLQPVVKGRDFQIQFNIFLKKIIAASEEMIASDNARVYQAGLRIKYATKRFRNYIKAGGMLSKSTFTT